MEPGTRLVDRMSERSIGWMWVGAQVVLIGLLIVLPGRTDWTLSDGLRTAIDITFWCGVAIAVVAGLSLGRALTATPVPTADGSLRTNGLYRFARHPIYTGVILIVVAMALRSQSFVSAVVGLATLAFFHAKAQWEERRLVARFPEYEAYATRTPRFVPGGQFLRR